MHQNRFFAAFVSVKILQCCVPLLPKVQIRLFNCVFALKFKAFGKKPLGKAMREIFQPLPQKNLCFGGKTLDLSRPQVMGILNVTPDSFSDGGQFVDPVAAVARAEQMAQQGASLIDIGAESTRPGASAVDAALQLQRLEAVVKGVRKALPKIWISVDTSVPLVMERCVDWGADMWNDVRALSHPNAAQTAARLDAPVVLMHHRGNSKNMDDLASYDDAPTQIQRELWALVDRALAAGVKKERVVIDVGMGFAKNFAQHTQLMRRLSDFAGEYPMLFGVSRKRFLGEVLDRAGLCQNGADPSSRDSAGVAAALLAVQQGASVIRTHNVAQTAEALALWRTLVER